jgi:hypothetical protein
MDRDSKLIFENYKKHLLNELVQAAPALPALGAGAAGAAGAGVGTAFPPLWVILGTAIIGSVAIYQLREYIDRANKEAKDQEKQNQQAKILQEFKTNLDNLSKQEPVDQNAFVSTITSGIRNFNNTIPSPATTSMVFEKASYLFKIDEQTGQIDLKSMFAGITMMLESLKTALGNYKQNIPNLKKQDSSFDVEAATRAADALNEQIRVIETRVRQIIISSGETSIDPFSQEQTPGYSGGGIPPRYPGYPPGYGGGDDEDDRDKKKKKKKKKSPFQKQFEKYAGKGLGMLANSVAYIVTSIILLWYLASVLISKKAGGEAIQGLVPQEKGLLPRTWEYLRGDEGGDNTDTLGGV